MRLLLCLLLFCLSAQAQTKLKIDKNTVAIDSAGNKHPISEWQKLIQDGYDIRPENPDDPNTRFLVVRLSEAELARRKQLVQKGMLPAATIKKGEKVRPINSVDVSGNAVALTDSTSGVTVLNFWFIRCAPCRKEMPELNEIVEKYAGDNRVRFYGIALDNKQELDSFLADTEFTYTIIPDGRNIAFAWGIEGYPTNIVVKDGKVVYISSGLGLGTVAALRSAIKQALK